MESLHIELKLLVDYLGGTADETQTVEIAKHLAGCPSCAILEMRVAKTIGLMKEDRLEEVPSHIYERTLDLFNQRQQLTTHETLSLSKKIFGIIDSITSDFAPAFGLRSGQPELIQEISLSAGEFEVKLQVSQKEENYLVFGEFYSRIIGQQVFLSNAENQYTAVINDLGQFSLAQVNKGNYQLLIKLNNTDTEIEFSEISIG